MENPDYFASFFTPSDLLMKKISRANRKAVAQAYGYNENFLTSILLFIPRMVISAIVGGLFQLSGGPPPGLQSGSVSPKLHLSEELYMHLASTARANGTGGFYSLQTRSFYNYMRNALGLEDNLESEALLFQLGEEYLLWLSAKHAGLFVAPWGSVILRDETTIELTVTNDNKENEEILKSSSSTFFAPYQPKTK